MKSIQYTAYDILVQLSDAIACLSEEVYSKPSKILTNASIGQHTRHIIEFFLVC